ncbi:MAG: lactate racemase domain-containing protein, partial [Planctomycetota bacterium]
MKIDLHYGSGLLSSGLLSLQIPKDNVAQVIRPWQADGKPDNLTLVEHTLTHSAVKSFQQEIAGKRLCVLTEDGTRDGPFEDIFALVFDILRGSSAVQFIICTGTHDAATNENNKIKEQIKEAAVGAGITSFEIHAHDCQNDNFIRAGR